MISWPVEWLTASKKKTLIHGINQLHSYRHTAPLVLPFQTAVQYNEHKYNITVCISACDNEWQALLIRITAKSKQLQIINRIVRFEERSYSCQFLRNNCNEFTTKLHRFNEKKNPTLFAKPFTITITGHSNKIYYVSKNIKTERALGLFDRASSSWNEVKCQLDATR